MTSAADGFLQLLGAEPTLMPPALYADLAAMELRSHELHSCLHCGRRAELVFVAHTKIGMRWLDLCKACGHWMQVDATKGPEIP